MSENGTIHPQLERLEKTALKVGAAGVALCAVGALLNLDQFFRSYLLGYLFWAGITLGSFGLLMVHHLSGGGWGYAIRRCLESAIRTLPLVALLLVPILLGVNRLYIWTDAELMAPWALKRDGQTIFSMPKAVVWRSFVLNHLVHHRGQLSVYLRMLDVPVPSMYGPSADESSF